MNERDLESRLRAAQRAEADQADPGALHERVHSIPERVEPQRRHWWSGFRVGAKRGADPGGNNPSRRQNRMILAASFVGIGVLALGGLFASNQVLQSDDPIAPGAEQTVVVAPVGWTGNFQKGQCPEDPTIETIGAADQKRGKVCHPTTANMTDERMSGTMTLAEHWDDYNGGIGGIGGDGFSLGSNSMTIVNEGGTWRLVPRVEVELDGFNDTTESWVFVGEDGYAGLISVAVGKPDRFGQELSGYIVETSLPPMPEIASAE